MTTPTKLEVARAAVRGEKFGTPAWEAKMVIVRKLVDEANANAPKFTHTSVDGDIWTP